MTEGPRVFSAYSDLEWQGVSAFLPEHCDRDRIRASLECAGREYWRRWEKERPSYRPDGERWGRVEKAASKLLEEIESMGSRNEVLADIGAELLVNASGCFAPSDDRQAIASASLLLGSIDAIVALAARRSERSRAMVKASRGAAVEPLRTLYFLVFYVWERELSQKVSVSRRQDRNTEPNSGGNFRQRVAGRLVDYFDAAVRPILGDDTPGAERIDELKDRYLEGMSRVDSIDAAAGMGEHQQRK